MSSVRERGTITLLKRGKRKITEARKEQNRIAQQVYRKSLHLAEPKTRH
jgi:hypothetical protein